MCSVGKNRRDSIQPFFCLPASWWDTGGSELIGLRTPTKHQSRSGHSLGHEDENVPCTLSLLKASGLMSIMAGYRNTPLLHLQAPALCSPTQMGGAWILPPTHLQKPHTCSYQEISCDCHGWQCSRQYDVENTQRCSQSLFFPALWKASLVNNFLVITGTSNYFGVVLKGV